MRIGNLDRQLASLAGPIFIETLLVMMLGAVDTFMLSRYSDNSVAAVGVVNQIMNLIFLLFEKHTPSFPKECSHPILGSYPPVPAYYGSK